MRKLPFTLLEKGCAAGSAISSVLTHRPCCFAFRLPIAMKQFYGDLFYTQSSTWDFCHRLLGSLFVVALILFVLAVLSVHRVQSQFPYRKDLRGARAQERRRGVL